MTNALTAIATLLYHHLNSTTRQRYTMLNALWIVLLGMAIIFAVLGVLLLVMVLLGKFARPKEKNEKECT
jgi:Na+-transporting methylmalonyl-CoA/oxaloacetate decarboxylase gamma subunit